MPLIMRIPGVEGSRRCQHPVSQIDLVPTLLDLLGEDVPAGLPGRSLRGVWDGTSKPGDVFIEWNRGRGNNDFDSMMAAAVLPKWLAEMAPVADIRAAMEGSSWAVITQDGWKLCLNSSDVDELYNLTEDAVETENLAGDPRQRERIADLTKRIQKWRREVGD